MALPLVLVDHPHPHPHPLDEPVIRRASHADRNRRTLRTGPNPPLATSSWRAWRTRSSRLTARVPAAVQRSTPPSKSASHGAGSPAHGSSWSCTAKVRVRIVKRRRWWSNAGMVCGSAHCARAEATFSIRLPGRPPGLKEPRRRSGRWSGDHRSAGGCSECMITGNMGPTQRTLLAWRALPRGLRRSGCRIRAMSPTVSLGRPIGAVLEGWQVKMAALSCTCRGRQSKRFADVVDRLAPNRSHGT